MIPSSGAGGRSTRHLPVSGGSDDEDEVEGGERGLLCRDRNAGGYQSFQRVERDAWEEEQDPAVQKVSATTSEAPQSFWGPVVVRNARNAVLLLLVSTGCVVLALALSSRSGSLSSSFSSITSPSSSSSSPRSSSWVKSAVKPNIIFLLADDLGYNSMQYSDTTDLTVSTPFLSKMAQDGIILTNYYALESCTPSRAALLTGRYPLTLGMQFNDVSTAGGWGLNDTEVLLPELLREEGYSTYMLGKWNLGHFSPKFLPTARGFDYFMGFLTGETYYWSKLCPQHTGIRDLLYADENCYHGYDGDDKHDYSTFLYRDKAIKVIRNHDYSAPLFMYLSFQGVHDPYHDHNLYSNGIPKEYVTDDVYNAIHTSVAGRERRQLAMALSIMDDAVKKVYRAVKQMGQSSNTVFVWTSDNGGCVLTGGRNGDLRGSKGTLFEGGTKVDAFIYSPLIAASARGSQYSSVFHVSDWLPTLLEIADIDYVPASGHELDGVSHASNLVADSPEEVRSSMLYNFYTNIEEQSRDGQMWNMWTDAPLAIRDAQYKLIHTYVNNDFSGWYSQDSKNEDDDSLVNAATCSQTDTLSGNYSFFLFDLVNDPYETVNLYDDEDYDDIKSDFYDALIKLAKGSRLDITTFMETAVATSVWVQHSNTIVPWVELDSGIDVLYPRYCRSTTIVSPSDNDDYSDAWGWADSTDDVSLDGDDDDSVLSRNDDLIDTTPTFRPTFRPTSVPSFAPDYTPPPSSEPTLAPSGPTAEPTGNAPQNLPTFKPTATKLTPPPTATSFTRKTVPPTMEPTSTDQLSILTQNPTSSGTTSFSTPIPITHAPTQSPPTPIPMTQAPTPTPPTPVPLTEPPTPELTVPPSPAVPTPIPLTLPPTTYQVGLGEPTLVPTTTTTSSMTLFPTPSMTLFPTPGSPSLLPTITALNPIPTPAFPVITSSPTLISNSVEPTLATDNGSRSPTLAAQPVQSPTTSLDEKVEMVDVVIAEDSEVEDEEGDVTVSMKKSKHPSSAPTFNDKVVRKTPPPTKKSQHTKYRKR